MESGQNILQKKCDLEQILKLWAKLNVNSATGKIIKRKWKVPLAAASSFRFTSCMEEAVQWKLQGCNNLWGVKGQ